MTIGVVIPTHNRPEHLDKALASLRHQIDFADEIIVVDDGSDTPVSQIIFSELADSHNCLLLRNERSIGANAARNVGARQSTSEYLAFLDDDDAFMPTKIATLRDVLAAQKPDVIYHRARIFYDREALQYDTKLSKHVTFEKLLVQNLVGGTSVGCVRKSTFDRVAGFDETLPALQDWDLWLRLAKAGAEFQGIDEVLTAYHFDTGKSAISRSVSKLENALDIINAKYPSELAQLTEAEAKQRRRTDAMRHAQRYALNGNPALAARSLFRGAMATRSLSLVAASFVALFGLKAMVMARRAWR